MKFPTEYENYPPRWATFDEGINEHRAADFKFAGTVPDVRRFGARYRASRCFREVKFVGMTESTSDGYSALCHLLLAYSAFEYLLLALGLDQHKTNTLLTTAERQKILKNISVLDSGGALVIFMKRHLRKAHQRELDLYLSGQPCNPFFLASGLRHLFAHGVLTPNPRDSAGRTIPSVAKVSRYLTRVLVKVMDREFGKQMDTFEASKPKTTRPS